MECGAAFPSLADVVFAAAQLIFPALFASFQMGIKGLTQLISDIAGGAIKETQIDTYFGRVVAVDASMSLYQFLIAVRPDDLGQFTLTNEHGETTRSACALPSRSSPSPRQGFLPIPLIRFSHLYSLCNFFLVFYV